MENEDNLIKKRTFSLIDGLVINREDEQGWLIEAFVDKKYLSYVQSIREHDEMMIKVKITREDNDPAFFISRIVSINEIGDHKMNILFQGKIVDQGKSRIEELLERIIEEGYQGESLLKKFKEQI